MNFTKSAKSQINSAVSLLYIIGAILYFLKPFVSPCKVAYPTSLLSLSIFFIHKKHNLLIFLALFFSALGDAAGALQLFIGQMGFFAIGHFFYVAHFIPYSTKINSKSLLYCTVVASILIGFVIYIFPFIHNDVEKYGIMAYTMIIFLMLVSTSFFSGTHQKMFLFAASLFIFSDITLAAERYLGQHVYGDYQIMITYYAAQYIFWRYSIQRAELLELDNDKSSVDINVKKI